MTREEIINEIRCLLSELDNGEDAVSYLTQNDVKWLKENIKALERGTAHIQAIYTEALEEGIRCAMCTNPIKSDKGCDGGCIVNTKMYNKVMTEINSRLFRKIPKEGYWKVVSDGYGDNAYICECSECKDTVWVYKDADRKWNYCPNCGAQMVEPWESEDEE